MIGIIGKGVVGTAVHYWLARFHDMIVHDPILGTTCLLYTSDAADE